MRRFAYLALFASLPSLAANRAWTIQTAAGSDDPGDRGPAVSAPLAGVEGITVDVWGNLWLADPADHRVRKVSPQGIITTLAGNGVSGSTGDGGPAAEARLASPYGVAADRSGNVFIAEFASGRVRRVSSAGVISSVGTKFIAPRNLAADATGNVYVSDFGGHQVYRISPGGDVSVFAGSGTAGFGGDGGAAVLASLRNPGGLAIDGFGAVYIADSGNHRIRRVWQGTITTVTGGPGVLASPTGVAVDSSGAVFIAESGNNRALKWNGNFTTVARDIPVRDLALDVFNNLYLAAGDHIFKMSSSGRLDWIAGDGGYSFRGDGGPAVDARLAGPYGIAADAAGSVHFSDQANHRIRSISRTGVITTIAGPPAVAAPAGVAVMPSGDVLYADFTNHRVRRITPGGVSIDVAGTGRAGFQGDGGPAAKAELNQPLGAAVDSSGAIYIADSGNHRIRSITRDGYLITIAGTGAKGYAGDNGSAFAAQFDTPKGVAVDAAGNIYVADTGNHAVRKITPLGVVRTILGTGVPGRAAGQLDSPSAVALDNEGNLYIADTGNHRVLFVGTDGSIQVAAGTGAAGFSGDGGPAEQAALNTPAGVAVDREGSVWIADHLNRRIRKLTPVVVAPPAVVEPPPAPLSVVNAASLKEGPVAPGEIVTVYGKGFRAGGTQLAFGRYLARVLNGSDTQMNALVPREVAGSVSVEVRALGAGVASAPAVLPVAACALGIFTAAGGYGQAAALNEDGSNNSAARPADRGSVVTFFATGEGLENLPVAADAGGYPAVIVWNGPAPGFAGLMQINARLPGGYAPGGALPLVLKAGPCESQPGVTIAVR